MTIDPDKLLAVLRRAHESIMKSDAIDVDEKKIIQRAFDVFRHHLMDENIDGFLKYYSEFAKRAPDAFDIFIDEVLDDAGVSDFDELLRKVGHEEDIEEARKSANGALSTANEHIEIDKETSAKELLKRVLESNLKSLASKQPRKGSLRDIMSKQSKAYWDKKPAPEINDEMIGNAKIVKDKGNLSSIKIENEITPFKKFLLL